MAVVKKYNTGKFFFSDRLKERLNSVLDSNFTIVEAPSGFGKTTAIKNLLDNIDDEVFYITIENDNDTILFEEICNFVQKLDLKVSIALKNIGCPKDDETVDKIVRLFSNITVNEHYILVFDNFQFVSNRFIKSVIFQLIDSIEEYLKIIIITQSIKYEPFIEMILEKKLNYIGKNDLEFTSEEIKLYFKECGIKLKDDEADFLFKYTEGWISAIYLQMLHYMTDSKFEADTGINNLVCTAIWDKLRIDEQDFLLSIAIFDSFSIKQAIYMGSEELDIDSIKRLLASNSFIRYDSQERRYYAHALLRYFLKLEFEKIDSIVRRQIFERAAKWYEQNEDYGRALEYYHKIKKFDDIYYMNFSLEDIIGYVNKQNKDLFIKIVSNCSYDAKEKNIRSSIILCFVLYMYNEKEFFENECNMIQEMIQNSKYLKSRERDYFLGEITFIKSYLYYNDINKMKEAYEKAYDLLKSPSNIYSRHIGITFRNPSVLDCFYSGSGAAMEELAIFEQMMIPYYKITSGDCKGAEAVMRAEILYNQGNHEDAEILCQKALYIAETRQQTGTYISTMFLMAKIAIFKGDYDNMKYIVESIRKKAIDEGGSENAFMADLCEGYIYMLLDKKDKVPTWLRDEKSIEDKTSVFSLAFADTIYAKYLINNENYTKLLGISGQMLGSAGIHHNKMYEIYLYIYISVANYKLGNMLNASKFINNAVSLAYKEGFVQPFIENYQYISDIHFTSDVKEAMDFIDKVKNLYKKYEKEYKSIMSDYRDDKDYGLTNRELQIAKLAAKRYTNKEIADQLYIAVGTVKSTLKTIFGKLHINSRSELKDFFE